jgi:hypothetical protein
MTTLQNDIIGANSRAVTQENARFMAKVYRWMTLGISLTAFVSYWLGSHTEMAVSLVQNRPLFWGLIIAQLGAVFYLATAIRRISAPVALGIYLAYAALTGVTLSTIFLAYTRGSIAQVFILTAFSFAGLSVFGSVTKRDLGPVGSFCTMGLFGIIGFGLISLFFPSLMTTTASQVFGIVGVIVFAGLTAYDTQKIKQMNDSQNAAVFGALTLYLDFINLFLSLLRLTGRRR